MLMLTLGMAVMVAMEVVLPLITEVVHLTSDPLSGVLEERSVMPMLMHSVSVYYTHLIAIAKGGQN